MILTAFVDLPLKHTLLSMNRSTNSIINRLLSDSDIIVVYIAASQSGSVHSKC